jgi:signal transduction histidine kinase
VAIGRVLAADLLPAVIAVIILIGGSKGASEHISQDRTPLDAFAYTILAIAGAAFVLRRRLPLALFAIDAVAATIYLGHGYAYGPLGPAVAIAAFIAAMRVRREVALGAGTAAGFALVTADLIGSSDHSLRGVLGSVVQLAWPIVPTVIGILVAVAHDARRTAEAESKQREVDEERLRLARDVHDVVGHGLSVISLQSGVALHLLDRDPAAARGALEAIRRASTEALDELRTTLALARDDTARRVPLSGLARLPGLVTEVRLCGLQVDIVVEGDADRTLPQSVDQVAFRVVQEALTNVLRHAGASAVHVTIRHDEHAVQIVVDDDGQQVGSAPADGGHGVVGLQERAGEIGGWCRAGPRADGGWRVEAWLPVDPAASAATVAP